MNYSSNGGCLGLGRMISVAIQGIKRHNKTSRTICPADKEPSVVVKVFSTGGVGFVLSSYSVFLS